MICVLRTICQVMTRRRRDALLIQCRGVLRFSGFGKAPSTHAAYYDSNDYYDASSTVKTDFMIITGDGTNSAMFHWDDQDYDGSFHLDDSELTLLGTLENFENDLLTSNELTVTLPYGA